MSKFTNRKGKLRLYDGAGTPYYLELDFDVGDFSGPLGQAKTEEMLVLDRGVMTADAHYIEGPDTKFMEPVPVTFSALVVDKTQCIYLLDWIEQMNNGDGSSPPQSSGQVNSNTLTSTKEDTQRDGANNNPAFADGTKLCCNLEYRLDGGPDRVWHYNEVFFELSAQQMSEAEDGVTIALNGMCYGTITRDTAFTSGTSVEA